MVVVQITFGNLPGFFFRWFRLLDGTFLSFQSKCFPTNVVIFRYFFFFSKGKERNIFMCTNIDVVLISFYIIYSFSFIYIQFFLHLCIKDWQKDLQQRYGVKMV